MDTNAMIPNGNTTDSAKIVTEGGKIQDDNAIDSAKLFNFYAYSSALADIISSQTTSTPLTIGIFGDWGSGKTSLMRTIQTNLEGNTTSGGGALKVKCIWFNAWEQSFGQGGMLTTGPSLLYHIYTGLGGEENKSEAFVKLSSSLFHVALDALSRRFLSQTEEEVKNKFKEATTSRASLAKIFHDAINYYCEAEGEEYRRVVVFIDDLDRCLPESTVEILEAIKLFLNSKHCIFVLGVDRRVITESIRIRYKDFTPASDKAESPITGDNYLEKIIQLSFQLPPIRTKDIEGFIKELKMPDFYEPYIEMISEGIEQNPRKVKRFLNNIELQRTLAYKIKDIKTIIEDETERGLFEALLVEWGIINSYYPPSIRADLSREPILLAEMHEYVKRGEKSLFSWDAISGDDKEKLITYLMEDHGVDWAKDAEISKSEDDKTTCIRKDKNSAEITIDDKTGKATLKVSGDDTTHDLKVKEEDGRRNIYVEVSVALKKFLNVGVGIENLKELIKKFPIAKLPKEDDVKRVIHLSRATETPAEETKAEKAMTKDEILDAIKNKKDLKDANMSNSDLKEINLSGVDLRGVNMSGADLSKAILKGVDLSNANLSGANLIDADLGAARLVRANLNGANLSKTKLRGADLSNANLSKADLSGANLVNAKLRRAQMDKCILKNADLKFCNIWYAQMQTVDLSGADLNGAKFDGTNMRGAIFENAKLKDTSLASANLSEAKFKGAEFSASNLDGAILDGADFRGADLDSSTIIFSLKKTSCKTVKFDHWVEKELEKSS